MFSRDKTVWWLSFDYLTLLQVDINTMPVVPWQDRDQDHLNSQQVQIGNSRPYCLVSLPLLGLKICMRQNNKGPLHLACLGTQDCHICINNFGVYCFARYYELQIFIENGLIMHAVDKSLPVTLHDMTDDANSWQLHITRWRLPGENLSWAVGSWFRRVSLGLHKLPDHFSWENVYFYVLLCILVDYALHLQWPKFLWAQWHCIFLYEIYPYAYAINICSYLFSQHVQAKHPGKVMRPEH